MKVATEYSTQLLLANCKKRQLVLLFAAINAITYFGKLLECLNN